MRLCFVIGRLFRSGGLQRDCVEIARRVRTGGHDVTIVCCEADGTRETAGVPVEVIPSRSWTNPGRDRALGEAVARLRRERFDRVVGFNKMPGLDVYYAGDPPYTLTRGTGIRALMPRYFAQLKLEEACFDPAAPTRIICLTVRQAESYRSVWNTPHDRFRIIPPSLDVERRAPDARRNGVGARERARLGLGEGSLLLLAVTAHGRTKGLDRSIAALPALPGAVLAVAGIADSGREGRRAIRLAARLGVTDRLRLLGHVEDITGVMAAADLLVHPARAETAGMAILEAIANGLPVITTALCGFAEHVSRAGAGIVLDEPFDAAAFAAALATARHAALRARWSAAGASYGADANLTAGHAASAALIAGELW